MAKGRVLKEISLSAIAAVDFPCQEHAKMTIIKRAVAKAAALRADLAKIDIPAARGFLEILAENEQQAASWEAESKMWPLFDALRSSLSSIAADANIDPAAKVSRVEESVTQFISALKAEWPDVAEEVVKTAKASANGDAMSLFITAGQPGPTLGKGTPMSDELKKALGLAATATDADVTKAIADLVAKAATLTTDLTKAQADLATANGALEKAKKNPFADMESDDGKPTKKGLDFIAKHASGADEIIKVGDQTISKAAVGEATFTMFKAQQAQIDIEKGLRIDAEMAKRAESEFPSIVGTAAEKGAVLKHLESAPEAVRKSAEAIFKAAEAAIKGAFSQSGTSGGFTQGGADIAKARQDFMSKVNEIKGRDNCSKTDAMSKAATEFPDLYKAYQGGDGGEAIAA
jgi:hypothetical protein